MSNPLQGNPDASQLRKEAGAYLKKLRNAAGLTQNEVAKGLGLEYYTLIAQIEAGKTRVPPDKLMALAGLFEMRPSDLGKRLLQYYDPRMWEMLFGPKADIEP